MLSRIILICLFLPAFAIAQNDTELNVKARLIELRLDLNKKIKEIDELKKSVEFKNLKVTTKKIQLLEKKKKEKETIEKKIKAIVDTGTAQGFSRERLQKFYDDLSQELKAETTSPNLIFNDSKKTNQPAQANDVNDPETGIQKESTDQAQKHVEKIPEEIKPNEYLLFGNDKVLKVEELTKVNKQFAETLTAGINNKSLSHFGTFKIPKHLDTIWVVTSPKAINDKKLLYFKKVDFELNEGSIVDINVQLMDSMGNTHSFTNKSPIAFLNFDHTSQINYLRYTAHKTTESLRYKDYLLRVSDILQYDYTIGGNYVPDDIAFSFPIIDEDEQRTNQNAAATYKLEQSTALKNVIELRAYTDIFGLNDTEANGLASIEGQAAFFLNTRNWINTNLFLFRRVRPHLSFSRFEDEDRFVTLDAGNDSQNSLSIANSLELIQKSYFKIGIDLDVFSYKIKKQSPFEFSLFGTARYQAADLDLESDDGKQYTSMGLGGGVKVHLKRFNNFTLDYILTWVDYRADGLNDIDGIIDPSNFVVFENQMELSWFPTGHKNSALFARVKTYDDQSRNSDNHFFQAEIGYRFSLGAGSIIEKK